MTDNSPEYFEKLADEFETITGLYPSVSDTYAAALRAAATLARENAELRRRNDELLAIDLPAVYTRAESAERENAELRVSRDTYARDAASLLAISKAAADALESAESANRALQAEVDRLREALQHAPCNCIYGETRSAQTGRVLERKRTHICERCTAIAYTGAEPQEETK